MMEERYYVLEKFAEVSKALISLSESMPLKRRAVARYQEKGDIPKAKDTYEELKSARERLLEVVMTAKLLFLETDMSDCAAYAGKLYAAAQKFSLMANDYTKFTGAVEALIKDIPQGETTNAGIVGRLMNNIRTGYYPTDTEHIRMMQRAIIFPQNRVNLLDPCCGCGLALQALAADTDSAAYGIELDECRGQEAEERLDRVGFGSFFYSRLSNEAFHAILLNPPYISVLTENGKARHEKRFLADSLNYLMYGGLMLYIIPYYRLTADICRVLCDNFSELRVYRFLDREFSKFKQIVVFGVRKKKCDGSGLVDSLVNYAMSPESIPFLDTAPEGIYALPDISKRVDIFKGAEFNLGELQRQLKSSKSIDRLFEKSKLDAMEKRPLLPLNVGQIGLVGGSGLINGYVDCDYPHVIKGRVVKEIKRHVDEEASILTETRVNRMIFNVLTPSGFKSLA